MGMGFFYSLSHQSHILLGKPIFILDITLLVDRTKKNMQIVLDMFLTELNLKIHFVALMKVNIFVKCVTAAIFILLFCLYNLFLCGAILRRLLILSLYCIVFHC